MMYYRISKNGKNLFFGKKIAQVWAVTLKRKMWRERQNEDHETQSSLWFVTWRRLHIVQTKKAYYHAEMPVKYCF